MRIISKFHDYYDSVQAQGQDQTVVYIREQKEEELEKWPFPVCEAVSWSWSRAELKCREYIVGFCGKIYPVLELGKRVPSSVDLTALCWTLEDVDAFVEANFSKEKVAAYRKVKGYEYRRWKQQSKRVKFQKFFDECNQRKEAYLEMFRENRSPIFVADFSRRWWSATGWKSDHKITWNAELKEWEFYKIFDVYSTFQEVACFMSGLAIPLKPIPDIDDKVMAGAKGFNEWSFRKEPTKKR